ncbi:MAG: 50S ribosomal protein L30 [bacterium]
MKKLTIKQVKSVNDTLKNHKLTIKALGLGRPNYVVVKNDSPAIRGMIRTVRHLVEVTEA